MAEYILRNRDDDDHWKPVTKRPPTEGSDFTATFVALRGLRAYGTNEQRDRIADRSARARTWLTKSLGVDTEDRTFRLRALKLADADKDALRLAVEGLCATQRPDGGWAQVDGGESDAYATGSALVALHESGSLAVDNPVYRRGLTFLIKDQRQDGSWYVKSRSRPFQTYFESGFPYGKDQFISISASGWAATALLLALPEPG